MEQAVSDARSGTRRQGDRGRVAAAIVQPLERRVFLSGALPLSVSMVDGSAPLATAADPAADAAFTSSLWGEQGEAYNPAGRLLDYSYAGYHAGNDPLPSTFERNFNVRDFGATGDGTTDDTAAVLRAIAAAQDASRDNPTGHSAVRFPAGGYVLSEILRIRQSRVVLTGDGPDQTFLHFTRDLNTLIGNTPSPGGNSQWSSEGGLIWAEPTTPETPQSLSAITAPALRGDRTLTVSDASALSVGRRVRLLLTDDGTGSLLRHLHGGLMDGGRISPGLFDTFTSRVAAIRGDVVTLERALPTDVRPEWTPVLQTYAPALSEVGVQHLAMIFPDVALKPHHEETGYNGIRYRDLADSWVTDVRLHNPDSAILVGDANNVTVSKVTLTSFGSGRDNVDDFRGHHGLAAFHSADLLFTDFDVRVRYRHAMSVDRAYGSVFARGSGRDMNMSLDRRTSYANLFTDLDLGAGTIPWFGSGDPDWGSPAAAFTTFWNLLADRSINLPADADYGPSLNFVSVRGADALDVPAGARDWLVESIPQGTLSPANLYDAQLARRLASVPAGGPPVVTLAADAATGHVAPATIALRADVTDPDGDVTRVEFYQGGTLLGSDEAAPFEWTFTEAPAGSYAFSATAIDFAGHATTSAAVPVTVAPPVAAPAGGARQFESLTTKGKITGTLAPFTDPAAGGGAALLLTPPKKSATVAFLLGDVEPGTYRLTLRVARGPDAGILRLAGPKSKDGPAGNRADLYASEPGYDTIDFGTVTFRGPSSKPRVLKLKVAGRNPLSTGFALGLDALTLFPA